MDSTLFVIVLPTVHETRTAAYLNAESRILRKYTRQPQLYATQQQKVDKILWNFTRVRVQSHATELLLGRG